MFKSTKMLPFIFRSNLDRLPFLFILFLLCTLSSADKDKRRDKKDGYLTEYACEGKSVHIKCKKPGTVINVIRANYGRYSIATCNDQGILHWKVDCTSHKTLYVIQNRCNNKPECVIEASSILFGDACPGTPKYLEAQYTCISYNTDNLSNLTSNAGNLLSNDPFGFGHSIDSKQTQPGRNNSSRTSLIPKIGNPFQSGKSSNQLFNTPSSTTEALPKIIVPNLPIHNPQVVTQPTIKPTKLTPKISTVNIITTTPQPVHKDSSPDSRKVLSEEETKNSAVSRTNEETSNVFSINQTVIQNGNYNKVFNDLQHNSISNVQNEQTRTPASSSPFVKSSPELKQQPTNTESTNQQSSNDLDSRNTALIKRSMLNSAQNTALSIFLIISIIISIGVLCLTFMIFIFSRPSSKRIINYMNISLVLVLMEIILLIAISKKSINYSNLFSLQHQNHDHRQEINILSMPSLLAVGFYYLMQVLFNLLLIESIRIYSNYLLNRRTLKSRGYIYYTGADQQVDSTLLNYIRWSRSKCLTFGLAYLLPVFSCCLILSFDEDSLKFLISSLLLIEPPVMTNLSPINQVPPPSMINRTSPEDHYPQLGLLILCFAFTYLVLFIAILLIFIAAKGCWRLQQQQQRNCTLGKLNDSHKFGSTSTYSNAALSSANYNQLTLNSLKQNGTSAPQIAQINTLAANNHDNSLCSAQLDPSYLVNYTKRATMKLLIIVLIGQTFCWSFWLALCHLNSRLNVHLDLLNEFDQQSHLSLAAILQVLVAIFSCLNIAQSIFVLASAFHKNHKINSSSIEPTDRSLFGSRMQFSLKCLPICVRKTGASPLPLIGGSNQLSSSALNSAASSIQQSQLMIQPNNNSTGQQPVYFYSLDPNQLNNVNQLNNQSNQNQQPPSPIIKLNTNFHTMMNRNSNNYLSRDVNTMCRQPTKHNDYLLATSTTNNRMLNSKSQHSLVPYLIQQQNRPQSYVSSNQRFQDVNPYAPPVLIDDHRLNEQLMSENLLANKMSDNGDYEEVMPINFDNYLNSNILQPGQQSNNVLLNAANAAMNRHSQATLRLVNNGNKNSMTNSSRTNSTNSDNQNSFNNLQQFIPNYNTNGQSNLQQNNQQFESEQDIYESVESPCIYTRSPIYYSEGNRG